MTSVWRPVDGPVVRGDVPIPPVATYRPPGETV
jgi:hypothetical protein